MPRQTPSAHADPLPDDLLNLRDAAALAGRSADTLRRWRGTHGLRDYRDPADPTAPSVFSRSELLAVLARVNARRPAGGADYIDGVAVGSADPLPTPLPTRPPTPGALPGGGGLALVHQLVDDLRADRERLLAEAQAERARAEAERTRADAAAATLDAARRETLELAVRLERLETLLVSGRSSMLEAERVKLADRRGVKVKARKRKGGG